MNYKVFSEIFNLQLYYQVKNLVYRSLKMRAADTDNTLLGYNHPKQSIEQSYGLRYLGEIFERYEERIGGDIKNLRAIAFAAAQMKKYLKSDMFVDSQDRKFIQRIRPLCGEDLFLAGALYGLTESCSEKKAIYKQFNHYKYEHTYELIFALAVIHEEATAWKEFYGLTVKFLGNGRDLPVYGNEGVFMWFINAFEYHIKEARSKDAGTLKALKSLVEKRVKQETRPFQYLLNSGYSKQEIMYLNMYCMVNRVTALSQVTIERSVAAFCDFFLNSEHIENITIVEFCLKLMQAYYTLGTSIQGYKYLSTLLSETVRVKNIDVFKKLYGINEKWNLNSICFCIDLLDSKWDFLYSFLTEEKYISLFEQCVSRCNYSNLQLWLDKFKEVAGYNYEEMFWTRVYNEQSFKIFEIVMDGKEENHLLELYKQYRNESEENKEKWTYMKDYLVKNISLLHSGYVFEVWDFIVQNDGLEKLVKQIGERNLLTSVWLKDSNDVQQKEHLSFLSKEQKERLYTLAEDFMFRYNPSSYKEYVFQYLMHKDTPMSKKEKRELARVLNPYLETGGWKQNSLMQLYYSKKEIQEYEKAVEEAKQRRIKETHLKKIQEYTELFNDKLKNTKTKDEFLQTTINLVKSSAYMNAEYCEVCKNFLEQAFIQDKVLISISSLSGFLDGTSKMIGRGYLDLNTLKSMVGKLEVVE